MKKALVFIIEIRVQGFTRLLIRSCHQTFEIQSDGKSKREVLILLENSIKGFQKSMIKILLLDFRNSKWRIQYSVTCIHT